MMQHLDLKFDNKRLGVEATSFPIGLKIVKLMLCPLNQTIQTNLNYPYDKKKTSDPLFGQTCLTNAFHKRVFEVRVYEILFFCLCMFKVRDLTSLHTAKHV